LAFYYLETSALVKLYVREPGTDRLLQLAAISSGNRLALLSISQVEFRSAIRRRERNGDIASNVVGLVLDRFQQHFETRFLQQGLTDAVLDGAIEMIDRYALRTYDAIQLSGYLVLRTTLGGELTAFVCSDRVLLEAARSEQIPVLDPCALN
jgi:predicted nucleic acid-binding protein